jgi:glucose/arabinose dehydrogenase
MSRLWGSPSRPAQSWVAPFEQGAFVGLHGSWNRTPKAGYKVVFVPFEKDGRSSLNGKPIDVLKWLPHPGHRECARPPGRCAGRGDGALLVSDDTAA